MKEPHSSRRLLAGVALSPPPARQKSGKLWLVLWMMLAWTSLLAPLAYAQQFGDFRYSSNGTAITITGYFGAGGAIAIPDTIDELPVRAIWRNAFSQENALTSVIIPDSVTSIGDSAFSGCIGLTDAPLPNSVTSIGGWAFSGCTRLASVTIPNSVTSIGSGAFARCASLPSIKVETGNTAYLSVDGVLFNLSQTILMQYPAGKTGSYVVPDSIISIETSAFASSAGLTSVVIPNRVTSIGSGAFIRCTSLLGIEVATGNTAYLSVEGVLFNRRQTRLIQYPAGKTGSYVIPDSVTSIDASAFAASAGLTGVVIPDGVTSIESSVFSGCSGLTDVTLPDGLTSIGEGAFNGCRSLTSVTIPHRVTSIGNFAFAGCTRLTNVTIPGSVTSIRSLAFSDCTSLTSVTIPDSVTLIERSAFYGCSSLGSVTIGSGITFIKDSMFKGCTGLTSVTIPDNVALIEWSAFDGCTSLTSVSIPNNVISIGINAFRGCTELINITIPSSVTSIGGSAFNGCTRLTSAFFTGNAPTSFGASAFSNAAPGFTISYYEGRTGFTSPIWQGYPATTVALAQDGDFIYHSDDSAIIITGYTGAGGSAAIPETMAGLPVRTIGGNAFKAQTAITNVTIPNSVTFIGALAFEDCTGLGSVAIGDGVTSIGTGAFNNCAGLTGVTIGNSVTSIKNAAFYGCTGLTSVIIPGSVTSIGNQAFYGCTELTSATFEGDTPALFDTWVFNETAPGFTIYYYKSSTGFTSPSWRGYPAVALGDPSRPTLEDWRQQHFGEGATNTGDAADDADPDGDGFTNVEEYAAGTDPKSAASQWQVESLTKADATFTVTFDAQLGRRYELQRLLVTPEAAWQTVAMQDAPATAGPVSLTDPEAPAVAALYRVRVTVP